MSVRLRRNALIATSFLAGLSLLASARSQSGRVPSSAAGVKAAPEPEMPGKTGRVVLDVIVDAKSTGPVGGLQQQDFSLLDNKAPRTIASFRAVGTEQTPTEVTLVIDAVNTSFNVVASLRQQLDKYLQANGGHLSQPTALAIFTDAGMRLQPTYSTDGTALSATLDSEEIGLREIRRSEGFYGADERAQLSIGALDRLIRQIGSRPGRKVIVWISPGWPILSGPNIQLSGDQQRNIFQNVVSLTTRLREAHITLYSADPVGAVESVGRSTYYESYLKGVSKPGQADLADLSLQVLATHSGGRVLLGNNDAGQYLKQIFAETGPYYEIGFDAPPADHPDEYHKVEIRVDKPGLTVRSEDGYYDEP